MVSSPSSAAICSSGSRRTSTSASLAPSCASRRAVAAPIPSAAPVTTATLPFSPLSAMCASDQLCCWPLCVQLGQHHAAESRELVEDHLVSDARQVEADVHTVDVEPLEVLADLLRDAL